MLTQKKLEGIEKRLKCIEKMEQETGGFNPDKDRLNTYGLCSKDLRELLNEVQQLQTYIVNQKMDYWKHVFDCEPTEEGLYLIKRIIKKRPIIEMATYDPIRKDMCVEHGVWLQHFVKDYCWNKIEEE